MDLKTLVLSPIFIIFFSTYYYANGQNVSTVGEIYDFEIGDIYHLYWEAGDEMDWFESFTNIEIIGKYYTTDSSGVYYVKDISYMERSSFWITWDYDYYIDTVYYGLLDSLVNNGLIDYVYTDDDLYNGRLINVRIDTLWNCNRRRKFVVGCGLADIYYDFPSLSGYNHESLHYFKKGDEEWGTPMYVLVKDQKAPINTISMFPNPFTSSTTLSYTLDKPENVQFTMYNVQSQIVYLMQEKQDKGEHHVQWNAEGLPAGMYYFRILAGGMTGSGKIIKLQ